MVHRDPIKERTEGRMGGLSLSECDDQPFHVEKIKTWSRQRRRKVALL